MPTMDGWSVLAELKSDPALADIPVVMVTLVENQKVAYRLGAEDYLTKPVDRAKLLQVLRKHVSPESDDPVLIVEDEKPVRELLKATLEREGMRVETAAEGKAALRMMEDSRPALVLLDLLMPEMDGFEFMDRIREVEDWKNIPVVVITALSLSDEDRERLRGRAERIFHKGDYTEEDLLREIQYIVTGTASFDPQV
jgi:CheY-like chemotaxis protein